MQFIVLILLALIASVTHAAIRRVPNEYPTIQAAILAAQDQHDTVLVYEGTYVENIDFRGRSIVVGSLFVIDGDIAHIPNTIIDGSQPANSDTGSVVRIISGEDSTTALIGFTITGGTGTKFRDQSDQLWYVEGGGVIIENSDPLIAFNVIVNNEATRRPAGTQSAGGGGIRYGYCSPKIHNNVILNNSGLYGGGIVSFFADGDIRNNVIANNDGGQAYGGGGLWIGGTGHSTTLINNTIGGNTSVLTGGGIRLFAGVLDGHGNIVWGNEANSGTDQIAGESNNVHLSYGCVEGDLGHHEIEVYPGFDTHNLTLNPNSLLINSGDPDPAWNDPNGSRNDIGCYGGPGAHEFFAFGNPEIALPVTTVDFDGTWLDAYLPRANQGTSTVFVDSITYSLDVCAWLVIDSAGFEPILAFARDTILIQYIPCDGILQPFEDTLQVYHSDSSATNPWLVPISLVATDANSSPILPFDFALHSAYPNPFNPSTTIAFSLPSEQLVKIAIHDIQGREVAQLVNSRLSAGEHVVEWNANSFASGTYFATMRAGKWQAQTKLTLLK